MDCGISLAQGGIPDFRTCPCESCRVRDIARLREGHKGEIVEPLAFLSVMKWLEQTNNLSEEARLQLRLADPAARGSAFEEVGILYLLRALRYPVPFNTVFDFRITPFLGERKVPDCRTPG